MQLQEALRERDELQQTIDDGNARYEVHLSKSRHDIFPYMPDIKFYFSILGPALGSVACIGQPYPHHLLVLVCAQISQSLSNAACFTIVAPTACRNRSRMSTKWLPIWRAWRSAAPRQSSSTCGARSRTVKPLRTSSHNWRRSKGKGAIFCTSLLHTNEIAANYSTHGYSKVSYTTLQ